MLQASARGRLPLMALAMLLLLAAMWAGLVRMGWALPPLQPALAGSHGALMVSGFLGTLISLERSVALGQRWTYAAPLLTGLGGAVLAVGLDLRLAALLITLGSLVLVVVFLAILRRQPALHIAVLAVAAAVWSLGNGLWLAGRPVYAAVPWWAGFLILTIAGERLELSRVLHLAGSVRRLFYGTVGLILAGLLLTLIWHDAGIRLAGAGQLALALWLLRHDVARRTVRQTGITRFIAVSLLSGYVWLGVAGLLALRYGGVMAGPLYDAILHSIFLGFVFSMIFGHAPVIFPAVMRRPMAYSPVFYSHLALLHLSLLTRVGGDLAGSLALRQWGGLLNVLTILVFMVNTTRAVRSGRPGVAS